jgi:hypothetical protein
MAVNYTKKDQNITYTAGYGIPTHSGSTGDEYVDVSGGTRYIYVTTWVPFVTNDVYVTGGTYSSGTATFTNSTGGTFSVTGLSSTDTYVTGFTYSSNTLTILRNQGQSDLTTIINTFTGLTVNGNLTVTGNTSVQGLTGTTATISGSGQNILTVIGSGSTSPLLKVQGSSGDIFSVTDSLTGSIFSVNNASNTTILDVSSNNIVTIYSGLTVNGNLTVTGNTSLQGLTATTISATTYQNLPTDIRVTGGTYSNGTTIFTNNTGGTFSVTGYYTGGTDVYVTGGTYSGGDIIFTNNTGGTFSVTGLSSTDTFTTGFTYSSNTLTIKQNQGQPDKSVTINTMTGLTITGDLSASTITTPLLTATTANVTYLDNSYIRDNSGVVSIDNINRQLKDSGGSQVKFDWELMKFPTLTTNGFLRTSNGDGSIIVDTSSYLSLSGGTVTGSTNFSGGLTANTISATTYYNLPTDVYVTGGTYTGGDITFTNNTGGTFSVTGLSSTDTFTTGFTYSSNTLTIKQNQGQSDLSVLIDTMTGLTVNGNISATTISLNNYLEFNTGTTSPSLVSGRVFYNNDAHSLSYYPDGGKNVIVNMGQQQYIRVYNNSGTLISKGAAVKIQSAINGLPNITLAIASGHSTNNQVVGLAASDIASGSDGFVIANGILSGLTINTFNIGDIIYLSDTTPGGYVASTLSLQTSSRSNQIGYIIETGTTNGQIYVSILNENINSTITDIERNILEGNVISTGTYEFTGITTASTTSVNVALMRGWIVNNTYSYATAPEVINVYYTGGTNIAITNILTADVTYLLVNSGATLFQQTTFPTPQQRRENIFLGKVIHPNRSTIGSINNTPDFDVSPMSALRDLWTSIKLINQGIIVSANGANLNINTSAGTLWGNGIGFTTNQLNPDSISISGTSPTTFQYRVQTGGTFSDTTTIDVSRYDLNGVVTLIGGGAGSSTNQRVYLYPTGLVRIQYGQTVYGTLAAAVAAVQTETFVEYSNNRDNAILIGIISVNKNATQLNNTSQAVFNFVSKFGEVMGGTGGLSTTTLQQAYDNSTTPEIVINPTLGAVTIKNGTVNPDNTTRLLEGVTATNGVTSFVRADGYISGTTFQSNGFIGNNDGVTASTLNIITLGSGTSITNLGIDVNGRVVSGTTGGSTFTGGTVNGATIFTNGLTANTISATTYYNLPTDVYVTGGTYSSGTATFTNNTGGTFSVTGFTTGGSVSGDYLPLSGGTVTGVTIFQSGLTANTVYTDYIDFNTGYTGNVTTGRLQWDDGNGTLVLGLKGGLSDIEVGLENMALCFNSEATTLSAGTIVYVSGSQGNRPAIKRAIATNDGYSVTTLGMVSEPIASGDEGFVTTFGMVNNLNTLGLSGGTPIWLSPDVSGGYTSVKPQAPNHTVLIGYVVRISATVGSVFIHISNGWEVDELHDARITNKTFGDILTLSAYNGSDVWVNSKTLNGSYTITGDTIIGGSLTATTISATTYQNLPTDIRVTGGTYSAGTATFTNNTGGTFSVTGFYSGLTYFTESGTTETPNGTIPVVSLSATSAATNVDLAIIPKGTGSILAAIPDNTATGGNKRGNYAVDLQLSRTANTQVASGNYAVVLGQNNTASAANSVAIGTSNNANTAQNVAIGFSCTASGTLPCVAIGFSANASGQSAVSIGRSTVASGTYSFATGYGSNTYSIIGRKSHSPLFLTTTGDIQRSTIIFVRRTTDATVSVLTTDNGAVATAANQLNLQNNNSIRFKGSIVARQSGSTNTAAWDIDGLIQRGVNAASTTLLVGNVSVVQNTPGWGTPTLVANTTLGGLTINVSGLAATNIMWVATIDTTEVIYA